MKGKSEELLIGVQHEQASQKIFGRSGLEEDPFDLLSKKAFLAGYSNIRPVPNYNKITPILKLSRIIAIVGFCIKNKTWNTNHARLYQLKYLNNIVEQNHRGIKRITKPMMGFKAFYSAKVVLAGIELYRMLKKGQHIHTKNSHVFEQFYTASGIVSPGETLF